MVALHRVEGHLEIEIDGGALGPVFLTLHAPDTLGMPFSCPTFAVGYRTRPDVAHAASSEVCRRFGRAIAAVPGLDKRLFALIGNAPIASPEARVPENVNPAVVDAVSRLADGDVLGALASWRIARKGAPLHVRTLFSCVEGRILPGEVPPPSPPAEPASPGWALAWAGEIAGARRFAEAQPSDQETWALLGVLDVLERRSQAALTHLDRALAHSSREELLVYRAWALLQLGRLAEADQTLLRIVGHESLGQRVLRALITVRHGPLLPTFGRWCRRIAASDYHFNGLFSTELPALVGRAALDRAFESRAALANLLEGLLDRMAGNLGMSPTLAEVAPQGRRFVRAVIPPTPRMLAVEALHSLRHVGAIRAEAAFTALLTRRPRSVHTHTYRGELYLWLGRYRDAWRDFLAARRIEPVRWADVGMLAVLIFTGRLQTARLAAFYANNHFMSSIPGGTLPVYRGVLRRRLGDIRGAITDLRAALAVKPTRLGARVELCLALRAAGLPAAASQHAAVLLRDAAPLLVDAADALGIDWRVQTTRLVEDAVLEEALYSMRGNRSSSLVTWLDRSGSLRILTPPGELRERAAQTLGGLRVSFPAGRQNHPHDG
jgi:tetratricopeptide (TPR) repeat protein